MGQRNLNQLLKKANCGTNKEDFEQMFIDKF